MYSCMLPNLGVLALGMVVRESRHLRLELLQPQRVGLGTLSKVSALSW